MFFEPRSSFKNLTNLHLRRVIITNLDPFSGFPSLEKLRLVDCRLNTNGTVLNVHLPQLSELTISNRNYQRVNRCELATPKLRYFEYRGCNIPHLTTHQGGLPVLETVVIDHNGFCGLNQEKIMFDDVVMLFNTLCNAKSLTVFLSIVHLLLLFPGELVNRRSPFRDLKCLKVDFSFFLTQHFFESRDKTWRETMEFLPGLRDYLLQKSHDAEFTVIYPNRFKIKRKRFDGILKRLISYFI
ncbi:hypothetical protein L1987_34610 [Smallanthus sonchifolius]|uniref:Uncharacterized protein n=1 Tax=Smallanthus sonchifolius TaxID=185202 RepID=A0ACB9HWW5_9ASTR|nr:hypothetical protein L1987_34610 [Smallanthus sonchifolius]